MGAIPASRRFAGCVSGDWKHGSRSLRPASARSTNSRQAAPASSVRRLARCRSGGPRSRQAVPEHLLAKLRRAVQATSAGVSSGHRAAHTVCCRPIRHRCQIVARGGGGYYRFVGTPEQIVDFMEKWVDEGQPTASTCLWMFTPRVLRPSWIVIRFSRSACRFEVEEKTSGNGFSFPRPERVLSAGARPLPPFAETAGLTAKFPADYFHQPGRGKPRPRFRAT
jgi:hypothetical protein